MRILPLFFVAMVLVQFGCGPRTSPEELLSKGDAAQKSQNFQQALEYYLQLINEHPRYEKADSVTFLIATIYNNDTREFAKAVDTYKQYLRQYPDGKYAPMALFLIGYLYNNELHNLDSAAAAYRAFLSRYPDHEMGYSARFELENLGKPAEEVLEKRVAIQNPPAEAPPPKAARTKK